MFDFLSKKFSSIFSHLRGNAQLSEADVRTALERIKDAFLEADVPYGLVQEFSQEIEQEAIGQKLVTSSIKPVEQLMKLVQDKMIHFFGGKQGETFSFELPAIVLVMGLQGSGKTTSIGKLAFFARKQAEKRGKKRRILLGSVDFYRPAAVDQLEMVAQKVEVDFYRAQNTNPVKAAQEIVAHYKNGQYDLLFLDTAGRLHIDNELLHELRAIEAQINPRYRFLVLDAMTGQESLQVARAFDQGVGFDGAILSKMDSDTRGGAAFSFRYGLKKPIRFIGEGERPEDLAPFAAERAVSRMLGMGDIQTLVERAEEKIKHAEQQEMEQSFMRGQMTLDDFSKQMDMMARMGSFSQVMKYLPGMGQQGLSDDALAKGEQEMKKFRAIISSMTPKERRVVKILDGSRKKRIACGAGVSPEDVNALLARFEQLQQYVKLFKRFGAFKQMFR